ncbi:unnamed protein product, partial [Owenia fusiformis]
TRELNFIIITANYNSNMKYIKDLRMMIGTNCKMRMRLILMSWLMAHPVVGQGSIQNINCNNQVTSCSCETDNGLIDLSPLDSNDPNYPTFYDQFDPDNNNRYSWNACSDFTEDYRAECTDVAVCQYTSTAEYYPLGTQTSAKFENDPTDGLRITYSQTYLGVERTTYVQLLCDPSATTASMDVKGEPTPTNFKMSLTSASCCPSGGPPPVTPGPSGGSIVVTVVTSISVGTILLIILAVALPLYLAGGMVFKRQRMGAQGVEMVPNIEFWKSIPGLAKDGTLFVVGSIRSKVGGQRNYENI